MEKITKKKFIEEMQKYPTYSMYHPPIPFYDKNDYQSFVNKDTEKMIKFMVEKLMYKDYMEKFAESAAGEQRTVSKVKSDGSLVFNTGSELTMKGFGKNVFFKHDTENGKSCLSCVSYWDCGDVQKILLLTYCINK